MNSASGRRRQTQRLRLFLCCCAWTAVVMGQVGCTGVGDWVHNGFKVGPNYQRPPVPVPPRWVDNDQQRLGVGEPNLAAWWDVFDDPVLTRLLHEAAAQNLTIRQAGIQIQAAQIQRNIALSELLPQAQTLVAGFTRGEVSRNNGVAPIAGATAGVDLTPSTVVTPQANPSTPINGAATQFSLAGTTTTGTSPLINGIAAGGGGGVPTGNSRFFSDWGTSANLSWELDFWGLFRRNLEAADASLNQEMQNCDELVIQLLANVATQYVEIRTLQRRLELARKNVREQEPLVSKLYDQWQTGIANSKPAYFQLKSNLDNTRALIPPLEVALRQTNNQLCILLGRPVYDMLPELGDGLVPDPADPKNKIVRIPRPVNEKVVVGIPGEILLRRPDVLAMEQQLRIQAAQIGIAEAQMYPHIGINGTIGLAANRLSLLFNQQSWIGSIGPSLTWNILDYGRLLANVRFQDKQYQQFVLAYQQSILNADQDAENSIVAYLQSLDQSRYLMDSANAAAEVTNYIVTQLKAGYLPPAATSLSYYNQLFTAFNFQVAQQDSAAQAEGNIALDLILLYRSLGGGWQIRTNDGNCAVAAIAAPPGENVVPLEPSPAVERAPTPAAAVQSLTWPWSFPQSGTISRGTSTANPLQPSPKQ